MVAHSSAGDFHRLSLCVAVLLWPANSQRRHVVITVLTNQIAKVEPAGELVLLDLDGTVSAREVNLAPQGSVTRR